MTLFRKLIKLLLYIDDFLCAVEDEVIGSEDIHLVGCSKWVVDRWTLASALPGVVKDLNGFLLYEPDLHFLQHFLFNEGFRFDSRGTRWVLNRLGMTLATVELTQIEHGLFTVQINEELDPPSRQVELAYGR